MNQFLTQADIAQILNESLEEAVADMPVAEQAEAKAAILNAFGMAMFR